MFSVKAEGKDDDDTWQIMIMIIILLFSGYCERGRRAAGSMLPATILRMQSVQLETKAQAAVLSKPAPIVNATGSRPDTLGYIPKEDEDGKARFVMGSTAGAGSGEFHIYRNIKRAEMFRVAEMKAAKEKEEENIEFQQEKLSRKLEVELKADGRSAKRKYALVLCWLALPYHYEGSNMYVCVGRRKKLRRRGRKRPL